MKSQNIVWLFALILLVFRFQGCKKDTTDDPADTVGDTVVDIDGNVYQKITIGTQTWMIEKSQNDEGTERRFDTRSNRLSIWAYLDHRRHLR